MEKIQDDLIAFQQKGSLNLDALQAKYAQYFSLISGTISPSRLVYSLVHHVALATTDPAAFNFACRQLRVLLQNLGDDGHAVQNVQKELAELFIYHVERKSIGEEGLVLLKKVFEKNGDLLHLLAAKTTTLLMKYALEQIKSGTNSAPLLECIAAAVPFARASNYKNCIVEYCLTLSDPFPYLHIFEAELLASQPYYSRYFAIIVNILSRYQQFQNAIERMERAIHSPYPILKR